MKKKGFTLIELLAVIVILAIIALIATPIILSMINNARKSAAKSSTYGFIEAIDSNNGFADADIAGYTKIADGTHNVSEINVPMKGKAPDSGTVKIENGKVSEANICVSGYTVTYEAGKEAQTGSKCNSGSSSSNVSTQATCPGSGCEYLYADEDTLEIGNSVVQNSVTDYNELNKPFFIGVIKNSNTNVIEKAYSCGIEGGTVFCLEGKEDTVYADNITVLNSVFPSCNASTSDTSADCSGSTVNAEIRNDGYVSLYGDDGYCDISHDGYIGCTPD